MKATELMIGDKVLVKVLSQIPDTYTIHTWTAEDYLRDLLQVKPIELTPEILEKNGFRYELDYGQFYRSILGDYAKEKEPYVSIRWNSKGHICCWEVSNKPSHLEGAVAYGYDNIAVHELQHALRLCGLNELADNFRI